MRLASFLLLLASMVVGGCAVAQDKPMAVDEGFSLSTKALDETQLKAANGDTEAAFRLSLHYSSGTNASPEKARFWRQIAAENGHAIAQYNIWFLDQENSDVVLRERALFWLRKSAASGFEDAKKQLSK